MAKHSFAVSGTGTKCLRNCFGNDLIKAITFSSNNPGTNHSNACGVS